MKKLYTDPSLSRYRDITDPSENAPYFPYVSLGSVSPDYPYPALALQNINSRGDENEWTWGDKFHKQHVGNLVNIGIQEIRQDRTEESNSIFLKKTAWLMGYYSHVITDLIIHAVVYKLVGGCYENHKTEHTHCEVTQDSLLFYDIYSNSRQELVDVHFLKILKKCEEPVYPDNPLEATEYILDSDISSLWESILSQIYPDFYADEPPKIDDWANVYDDLMMLATGVAARSLEPGIAYYRTADIPEDVKSKYYLNAILPDGTIGSYLDKVFRKTVDEVTRRLKDFLNAIDNVGSLNLGDWNLDKGTVDGEHPQFALWNGQTEFPFQCEGDPPKTA